MQVKINEMWRVDLGKRIFWLKNFSKSSSGHFELWNLPEKENKDFKDKVSKKEKEND